MQRCSVCGDSLVDDRGCLRCGDEAGLSHGDTRPMGESPPDERDLLKPGEVIEQRFRIGELIGSGGMGEVYGAEDRILSQKVALKLLPAHLGRDPQAKERLRSEVKVARRISHPNVCRVHDLGESDGRLFLSMELIDGEDLGTLLSRVGRLAGDRAVEIAIGICAGLAAAHAEGVLHRDLKPSNIMLDRRGRPRISDFGLAVLRSETGPAGELIGTPAYMAPEQLAGQPATEQTDLYSLGMVLFELFTGRHPFPNLNIGDRIRHQRTMTPTRPGEVVPEIPPRIEELILACLAENPDRRPRSALAVLTELYGGEAMQAHLAAGVTPSPSQVANAGSHSTLNPRLAWAALLGVAVSLAAILNFAPAVTVVSRAAPELPPQALAVRAREVLDAFGLRSVGGDEAWGFVLSLETERMPGVEPDHAVDFWYRWAPDHLLPMSLSGFGRVTLRDPPRLPGEARIMLNAQGGVHWLEATPRDPPLSGESPSWDELLRRISFDPQQFRAVEPGVPPPVFADQRLAWEGRSPIEPDRSVRVDAAAVAGQVVWIRVADPAAPAGSRTVFDMADLPEIRGFGGGLTLLLLVVAAFLAHHNIRAGRSNQQGALRVALLGMASSLVAWALRAHHVADPVGEMTLLVVAASRASFWAGMLWLYYVALEPYARRFWPQCLVSWNRLLDGRGRDPLVGRDVLLGCLIASVAGAVVLLLLRLPPLLGLQPPEPLITDTFPLLGSRYFLSALVENIQMAVVISLFLLLLLLLLRLVLGPRRALAVFAGLVALSTFAAFFATFGMHQVTMAVALVLLAAVWGTTLTRYGFLTLVVVVYFQSLAGKCPPAADADSWYFGLSVANVLLVFAVALWGAHVATGGRLLLGDPLKSS